MKAPALVLAILAGLCLSAAARAEEDIPAYQVLSCEKDCPPITPARVIDAPVPTYPLRYEGDGGLYAEALVDVDFTVAADGTVKDAAVESILGPQEFADNTLRAVNARRYQPATEAGQPVEESHRVRFFFHVRNRTPGARPSIVSAYQGAVALARDNKIPQGIAALREIVDRTQLNFYERTMAAYALAMLYTQTGDDLSARDMIRIATIGKARYLDSKTAADAIRLRIRLEALTGEFAEAFTWIGLLHERGEDDAREQKVADKLHGLIASSDALAMDGRIPAAGNPAFWQHTLLRRDFEFHAIDGRLDSFVLRCQRHGIGSAVSDKAHWTIPASWSGCFINVSGTPGTKFSFVESAPAPAGAVRPAAP